MITDLLKNVAGRYFPKCYDESMRWDGHEIVEAVAGHLERLARADDLEQAVYSIDRLEELELHPLIHAGLREAGFGTHPEQRYPSERTGRRKSEGKRCDAVLTPDDLPLAEPGAEATLFADENAVALEAAFWLEIKTVAQYTTEGPFARYGSELLATVSQDIRKLAQDRAIFHAGLLLVLFTESQEIAEHDLQAWYDRVLQRGYPVAPAIRHGFALTDRMGNGWCAVALFPVRRL